ncbi:glycosyl transferase [Pedobacter quisquiliarum]|uniref:Glycosyl transferase n=1 Tax=Pedobacter quisquiliarum TaxID=1834438 RepID=A0A916XE27_9SPHI|nr:glycosyl transferase [Pedobacter quisquiliarum]
MKSEYIPEVIIIDNNSSDGTKEFIREEFSTFQLVSLESNLGFGKANNLGIEMALCQGTDAVFLLNQDAYIQSDTLGQLVALSIAIEGVGILSPIQLNGDGTQIDVGFKNYLNQSRPLNDLYLNNEKVHASEVGFVNAAAWFLPKETLLVVGGFDPQFPHYGEDFDYCNRVKYHGLKIIVADDIVVCHDRQQILSSDVDKLSAKFENGIYVNLLALVKKPGDLKFLSFIKVFLYAMLQFSKEVIFLNFKVGLLYISTLLKIIGSFQLISQSKRSTRLRQSTFLKIELVEC